MIVRVELVGGPSDGGAIQSEDPCSGCGKSIAGHMYEVDGATYIASVSFDGVGRAWHVSPARLVALGSSLGAPGSLDSGSRDSKPGAPNDGQEPSR